MFKIRIRNKKHYYSRLPWVILIILFVTFSPAIIGLSGAWITELLTGQVANEGNSAWLASIWLVMITFPLGILLFIIYGFLVIFDSMKLHKQPTSC